MQTSITIHFQGKSQEVQVNLEEDVQLFQFQLLSIFNVEPEDQCITGLNLSDPTANLNDTGIVPGGSYTLTKKAANEVTPDLEAAIEGLVQKMGAAKAAQPPTPAQSYMQPSTPAQSYMQPSNPAQSNMIQKLHNNMIQVQQYEDPQLQFEARRCIPLEELQTRAASYPMISERDDLIVQLLRWYKGEFFKWVNDPPCNLCGGKCVNSGADAPTKEESYYRASQIEIYKCTICRGITRFPRYNHAGKLLETRRGRCGEWANCFTLLVRSLEYEARLVMDWTDHVWTEYYSEHMSRWVHCDCCEAKFDSPLMYEVGWGKKLSYVIAFSVFEIVDVTKRYTKDYPTILTRRTLVSEKFLSTQIEIINQLIAAEMDPSLREMISDRRAIELTLIDTAKDVSPEELDGRVSGALAWREARGELGPGTNKQTKFQLLKLADSVSLFDYKTFTNLTNLSFVGNAVGHDSVLQLTSSRNDQKGAVWLKKKININTSFQTAFVYQIGPQRGADGLAFVIQNSSSGINALGDGGSGKGYQSIEASIAIQVDTYENFEVTRDPNGNHISIHTNGTKPNSANHNYALACTKYNIPDLVGSPHAIVIRYENEILSVYLDDITDPVCSTKINLSSILSTSEAWVGFTAATGGLNEFHHILSWNFDTTSPSTSLATSPSTSSHVTSYSTSSHLASPSTSTSSHLTSPSTSSHLTSPSTSSQSTSSHVTSPSTSSHSTSRSTSTITSTNATSPITSPASNPTVPLTGLNTTTPLVGKQRKKLYTESKLIPQRAYVITDKPNFPAILKKLIQFNTNQSPHNLSSSDLETINSLVDILQKTSFYHTSTITHKMVELLEMILVKWPEDQIFPALDLLRLILNHPGGNKLLCQYGTFAELPSVFHKMSQLLLGIFSSQMIALKFFTNALAYQDSRECVNLVLDEVVVGFKECESASKKAIHENLVKCLFNCCIHLNSENTPQISEKVLVTISKLFQNDDVTSQPGLVNSLLLGVGNLIHGNRSNIEIFLRIPSLPNFIEKYIYCKDPNIVGLAIEINNLLI